MGGLKDLRIGFFGAGGTGKTSVMDEMQKREYITYPSVARGIIKSYGVVERDFLEKEEWFTLKVQEAIFEQKLHQDLEATCGVFERTILDTFVYLLMYCKNEVSNVKVWNYETVVKENMSRYDMLCYFPLTSFVDERDKFRVDKEPMRYVVDLMMLGYMLKWGIEYVKMPPGLVEERATFIERQAQLLVGVEV